MLIKVGVCLLRFGFLSLSFQISFKIQMSIFGVEISFSLKMYAFGSIHLFNWHSFFNGKNYQNELMLRQ